MMKHGGTEMKIARLSSRSRGRMRLKLGGGSHALLEKIKAHLEAQPGVGDVAVNTATGSALIAYDDSRQHHDDIIRLLEDLDVVVETIQSNAAPVGSASSVTGLAGAIDDLNAYVQRTLGVPVDFRVVMPLGLLGVGLWSIARRGLMIESVPGWVFLWLALDTFIKLHPHPAMATRGPEPRTASVS